METIFTIPWALNGEFDEVPLKIQEDGSVSFEEGFGLDYQKDLSQDPNAKNIERKHLNYILNTICNAINLINERTLLNNFLVGVPVPWPLDNIPDQCLKCNGSVFDTVKYSELAAIYVDGKTPDLRGEFIRGYDDGRGADLGRVLLSWQKGSYLVQEAAETVDNIVQFSLNTIESLGWDRTENTGELLRARAVSTEVAGAWHPPAQGLTGRAYLGYARPRNVAFNYIMRAY